MHGDAAIDDEALLKRVGFQHAVLHFYFEFTALHYLNRGDGWPPTERAAIPTAAICSVEASSGRP